MSILVVFFLDILLGGTYTQTEKEKQSNVWTHRILLFYSLGPGIMSFLTMSTDSFWDKVLATFVNVKVTMTGL